MSEQSDSVLGNPAFQMLIETQELLKAAKKLAPGDTLPNDEIVRITGRRLGEARGIATTVCRRMMADHGKAVVFQPKHYGGLHCLTDSERVILASTDMRGVGRKLKKTARVVTGAKDDGLTADERLQKTCLGTMCKLLSSVHGKAKRIAQSPIVQGDEPLRIGETLIDLFSNGKEKE